MPEVAVEEYRGYRIGMWPDEDCPSPRDADNVAVLAQLSDRFRQPDGPNRSSSSSGEQQRTVTLLVAAWQHYGRDLVKVERYARAFLGAAAVDWWDDPTSESRVVGIITRQDAERNGVPDAAASLRAELDQYALWATGECFGHIITRPDGRRLEDGDLWGLLGWDWALQNAKPFIDEDIAAQRQARTQMYRRLVNDRRPA